jgi:hypothetical protein
VFVKIIMDGNNLSNLKNLDSTHPKNEWFENKAYGNQSMGNLAQGAIVAKLHVLML